MGAFLTTTISAIKYYEDAENTTRFNYKLNSTNERAQTYKRWWKEQVRLYGTQVNYYARKFDIDKTDKVYGENPYQGFYPKATFVMLIDLTDGSQTYSQYGLVSDDELTAIIDIETFENELSATDYTGFTGPGGEDGPFTIQGKYPTRTAISPGTGDTLCKDIWLDSELIGIQTLSAGDTLAFQSVNGNTYVITASADVSDPDPGNPDTSLFETAQTAGTHFNVKSGDAEVTGERLVSQAIAQAINRSLSHVFSAEWRHRYKISSVPTSGDIYGFRITQKAKATSSTSLPLTITESDTESDGYWTGAATHNFDEKQIAEPNAGDVFQLIEFGDDRPEGRNGKIFEITERLDESVKEINQLQGHYVFKLRARRNDHTFLPVVGTAGDVAQELAAEAKSTQVSDVSGMGRVTDPDTDYGNDLDTEQSEYFEYGTNDDVYGDYY